MARIRTIKPEFWDSPSVAAASPWARLLFIAMWNWADDYGRGTANLKELEGFAFPNDDAFTDGSGNTVQFRALIAEVAECFGVVLYEVEGRRYYAIPTWEEHQRNERRAKQSKHPDPPENPQVTGDSRNMHGISATGERKAEDPPNGSGPGTGEQGNRGTGEQGTSADADTAPPEPQPVREDVERVCNVLADLVQENASNGQRPTITKGWRDAARLLIDKDGRTVEQIEWLSRWVQADDFWVANVRSMPKLREKFEQLVQTAKRSGTPKVDKAAQMILADRLRREAGTDTPKEIEQ
ncbi:hypothetical protein ACTXMZ_15585 [Brachybacterium alimentarium]|uniref:hypothetical protein n=1 Tax=Brachybacterium alimentarium TaxID=47845 RepID=UPI003FD35DC1